MFFFCTKCEGFLKISEPTISQDCLTTYAASVVILQVERHKEVSVYAMEIDSQAQSCVH